MAERLDQDSFLANSTKIPTTSASGNNLKKSNNSSSSSSISSSKSQRKGNGQNNGRSSDNDEEEERENCVQLTRTDPAALTLNLKKRFLSGRFFTDIALGEDLIFVNPGTLSHFRQTLPSSYGTFRNLRATSPHLFRQVLNCQRRAYDLKIDQCLLFSGSTGAGKSECLREAMQFLNWLKPSPVAEKAILVQKILSVFGSSSTQGNRMRTRIAPISNKQHSLLSQSGFQVFYALIYGATVTTLKSLKLQRNTANYAMLRRSKESETLPSSEVTTSDWGKATFLQIEEGLKKVGVSSAEQSAIWLILTLILKLGNLNFQASINLDGTPGCTLQQEYELHEICQLVGCDSGGLHSLLTTKLIISAPSRHPEPSSPSRVEYSAEEAQNQVDVISRALYSRLVSWLMRKLNTSALKNPAEANRLKHFGLLDLPGFDDSLEVNQFDQMFCNYAQERMHWYLLSTRLKEQQKLYILEGLEWEPVRGDEGGSVVCEQLEACMGLLDQSTIDVAQNSGFFSKLKKSSIASSPESRISLDSNNGFFIVRHFWGQESYTVENFVQKNLESITPECSRVFYESKSCPLMQQLFPEGSKYSTVQTKKRLSATSQFKANNMQRPNLFDANVVKQQIQALNISDLAGIRKLGYGWSQHYQEAFRRYRMLSEETWPTCHSTARHGLQNILDRRNIRQESYRFGRSCLFWKSYETIWSLEEARDLELHRLARLIQRAFRRYYNLYGVHTLHNAQIVIAAYFRAYVSRKDFLKKRNACILIAAHFKGWKKKTYLKRLATNLPSDSPTSTAWRSDTPRSCAAADAYIRILFHRWRCRQYRSRIDQQGYFKMREKLAASLIFRDKKAGYPFTVGHPFRGDYVRLRQNPKWRRISLDTSDEYVVFADMVSKIHRSSGKVSTMLLVVSTSGVLILDHRTLTVKHRASVEDIQKISLSPHADTLAVFHLGKSTALSRKSGDFLLECRHIIELVSKLYLVIQNSTGKPPQVELTPTIFLECDQERLELIFKPPGSTTVEEGIEVEDMSSKLTSCFQTSPSVHVRYATTSPTTASNLAVKMATAAVAGTSSGESTATPSLVSNRDHS